MVSRVFGAVPGAGWLGGWYLKNSSMAWTAATQDARAPTREYLRDPAPSETAINDQCLLARTSNQSSQLVPSCLCFLPRTRAPINREPSAVFVSEIVAYSSCLSGSESGTATYFHCGPVTRDGEFATAVS